MATQRSKKGSEKILERVLVGGALSAPNLVGKFGESLGGSQAPPTFWKVPGLRRKFPKLWRVPKPPLANPLVAERAFRARVSSGV